MVSKKAIISNTLLFVMIVAFIMAFSAVFGNDNVFIGITTVTAMLMLLGRDLTAHPIGNTMKLILLNLLIGVAAFVADSNMWLAIPVNFITMFIISYSLIYNLRNPLYFPFSLQYIFVLAFPVTAHELPLRLASLVVGAMAIMALQMLVNKNKITKSGDKKVQAIFTALITKIEKMNKGEDIEGLNKQITADISSLRNMIYDKREKEFFLTEEGQMRLNLSVSLEKINLLLNKMSKGDLHQEILDDLTQCLQLASDRIGTDEVPGDLRDSFTNILSKYKGEHTNSQLVLGILKSIDFLKDNVVELKTTDKKRFDLVDEIKQIPAKFNKHRLSEIPGHTKSIKLSYAIRMALGISICGFIIDFFDLSEGRWMMFTFLSVVIPIYEQSRQKMRDRVFATIVGVTLVTIFFSIFQTDTARSILLMLVGYLMFYIKPYRYNMILVTVSAIGAADLMTDMTEFLTVDRLVLVAAGVILALLLNKFVLPYTLKDAERDLKSMYKDTIYEMLKEVMGKVKRTSNPHGIKNLLMITNRIEDQIKHYNQESKDSLDEEWLEHQHLAASTIYELYMWIEKHGIKKEISPAALSYLQELLGRFEKETSLEKLVSTMKKQIFTMPDIQNRLMVNMILEVATELESSKAEHSSSVIC